MIANWKVMQDHSHSPILVDILRLKPFTTWIIFSLLSDFQLLFDKVHKDTKGLDKSKPRLERVPICSSILVTGLKDETSDDTIELYFENEKRSGGKDVSRVERKGKDEALVSFQDPASKKFN